MKITALAILAAAAAAIAFPGTSARAASPFVCDGQDEGFDVKTDCYGMPLTGADLRNAMIRELQAQNKSPAEISAALKVNILTVLTKPEPACPPNTAFLASEAAGTDKGQPIYNVQCAF